MVCLSVTFMHCAQMAEGINTVSFAYDSPMSPRSHLYLAYISQPLPLQIVPQSDPPFNSNITAVIDASGHLKSKYVCWWKFVMFLGSYVVSACCAEAASVTTRSMTCWRCVVARHYISSHHCCHPLSSFSTFLSPSSPTVAIWVQLLSILCQTGLSHHL